VNGRWRTAYKKFDVVSCLSCLMAGRQTRGAENFEFFLTEPEDREGSKESIEARFGIRFWFFIREDVLRRCRVCGRYSCTGYGYKDPPGGNYEHNSWPARVAARV